ncbi:MAG: redoxin domain-containing protein [Alphaproteobacteria bacterium]|nr:redoxin domain-containing protein [Alphaproteobacteria bacterium]
MKARSPIARSRISRNTRSTSPDLQPGKEFGYRRGAHPPRRRLDMADIGKPAPDFKLKSHDGKEVASSDFRGSKWVVISAYPFAFTGG